MSTKPILLIVEDDDDVRETIQEALASLSVDVITAEDGLKGLEKIKSHQVTAVLSDFNMPNMSGIELLVEIRKLGLDIPFVILTAYGDKTNTVLALKNGAFDFIDKPFNIVQLEKIVQRAIIYGQEIKSLEIELQKLEVGSTNQNNLKKILEAKKKILRMRYEISPK